MDVNKIESMLFSFDILEEIYSNNNIQYFIQNEKNVSSQQRDVGGVRNVCDETVRTRADFRVLRCFCGCTALTHEQIEHFSMSNVAALVNHPTSNKLFRSFLRIGHRTDKSEALNMIECHDLCARYLQNLHLIQDQSNIDQLMSLCPSFTWEQRLENAFEKGDDKETVQTLKSLQQECVSSIECHNDYDRFRRELLRKIGK